MVDAAKKRKTEPRKEEEIKVQSSTTRPRPGRILNYMHWGNVFVQALGWAGWTVASIYFGVFFFWRQLLHCKFVVAKVSPVTNISLKSLELRAMTNVCKN